MDWRRALLHFPVGVLTAWLDLTTPHVGLLFGFGFLTYQVLEDWRLKDGSYKDVFGYLVGVAVGAVVLHGVR